MSLKYLAVAAALSVGSAAFAQAPAPTGVQPGQPGSPEVGETSDRTPDKATQTPQAQQDTAGGKTSDRSQNKDVKVQHQPGAAGTAGSESSSEGASSGESGSGAGNFPSAMPPASSDSNAGGSLTIPTAPVAQAPAPTGVQPGQPGSPEVGETSDRTPDKATQIPQAQQDTAGGKTSDRSPNKDVRVQHQPGAAGTAGSESSSEGASSGESGSGAGNVPSAMPPASSDSNAGSSTTTPSADPPASSGSAK